MSTAKSNSKKRVSESESEQLRKRAIVEDDFDLDDVEVSSDIKGIMLAIKQIREKSHKDGQKKNDETISSVASDIKSKLDELKSKIEKERQNLAKALLKHSKEFENSLKNETAKFQAVYEKFCKEKAAHLQALEDTISKYEEEKEKFFIRYEQQRKKEKSMISEHEKGNSNKVAELEQSLKKKKQDDKTFSMLKKTLGSIFETASDEDI